MNENIVYWLKNSEYQKNVFKESDTHKNEQGILIGLHSLNERKLYIESCLFNLSTTIFSFLFQRGLLTLKMYIIG